MATLAAQSTETRQKSGTWHFNVDIPCLKHAPWFFARDGLLEQFGSSVRQLFLCDNLGIVLAFERCRSSHFGVLTQIRHFQSHCLALGIGAYHRWIPL